MIYTPKEIGPNPAATKRLIQTQVEGKGPTFLRKEVSLKEICVPQVKWLSIVCCEIISDKKGGNFGNAKFNRS
jgi:hypothetical protein